MLLLAGCCTHRGDLHDPVIEVSYTQFVCSNDIVIDADGRVWTNGGCEQDNDGDCWHAHGSIDAARRADLETRIAAVAPEGVPSGTSCGPTAGDIDRFTLSETRSHASGSFCRAGASAAANALVDDLIALTR